MLWGDRSLCLHLSFSENTSDKKENGTGDKNCSQSLQTIWCGIDNVCFVSVWLIVLICPTDVGYFHFTVSGTFRMPHTTSAFNTHNFNYVNLRHVLHPNQVFQNYDFSLKTHYANSSPSMVSYKFY